MGKNDPLKNKNGVTMVEMIVVFALISIFVAMSGQVIGSAMNIYHRIQGVEYGRQVSDTIMNKIVGELSGAQVASAQYDASGATDPYTIKIDSANSSIEFRDEGGSLVKIYSGRPQNYTYNDAADTEIAAGYDSGNPANWDHQLVIHYYVTKGATGETVYQPVDWTFDKSMYHGYEIQSLNFSRADYAEYPWHIIRVDLKLKSNTYGEYETTRYVECYHFRNNPDKILEEGNPLPVTPAPVPSSTPVPEPEPSATPEPAATATPVPVPSAVPTPSATPEPTPSAAPGMIPTAAPGAGESAVLVYDHTENDDPDPVAGSGQGENDRFCHRKYIYITDLASGRQVDLYRLEIIFDQEIFEVQNPSWFRYEIEGNKVTIMPLENATLPFWQSQIYYFAFISYYNLNVKEVHIYASE